MSINFGLILELMVLVLLATTIGYCFTLNKKLYNLRADEQLLRQTIRDLCVSIDSAERAVEHLNKTAMERETALKFLIESAQNVEGMLRKTQDGAHETLSVIQQQTKFSVDVVNRLKGLTQQAQARPVVVDIAEPSYADYQGADLDQAAASAPQKRRPFGGLNVFDRGAA